MADNKTSLMGSLVKIMFGGVRATAPILGTIWVLYLVCRTLLGIGDQITSAVITALDPSLVSSGFLENVPAIGILYFFLPLMLLYSLGILVRNRFGKSVLHCLEVFLSRIPVIGFVYKSLVQFVSAVDELGKDRQFKSVVYIEYPSPGCKLIGFVTSESIQIENGQEVTSVFVPTSPNPLTGFLILIENDKVTPSSMSVEQASKMVLSAGLVTPK